MRQVSLGWVRQTALRSLELHLKNVWKDGTRAIILEPHDLLTRLVAAVPPPRQHQLASNPGACSPSSSVDWSVPANLIAPNGDVYLELRPIDDDMVRYYNHTGAEPPVLIVDYIAP